LALYGSPKSIATISILDNGLHFYRTSSNASVRLDDKIKLAPRFDSLMDNASPIPDEAPVIQIVFILFFL